MGSTEEEERSLSMLESTYLLLPSLVASSAVLQEWADRVRNMTVVHTGGLTNTASELSLSLGLFL
jgi:hypothetical protein